MTLLIEFNHHTRRIPAWLAPLFGDYLRGRLVACFESWEEAGWEL